MRKNVLVKFIDQKQGVYDPYTGTYEEDKENVTEFYCNVTELTSERSFKEFGEYIQGGLVIRTTTPIKVPFQLVEINSKRYAVRSCVESLGRTSIVVVEIRGEKDGV